MILYLHGFLSTGNSSKAQWYKQQFKNEGIEVVTPTYPIATPDITLTFIEAEIARLKLNDKAEPWMLMGSSMGGFYAQYFAHKYQRAVIMINPALRPVEVLSNYVGCHVHPQTEEGIHIEQTYLERIANLQTPAYSNALVLVDKKDEIIPYESSVEVYKGTESVVAFEGGSHAFDHAEESWTQVLSFAKEYLKQ